MAISWERASIFAAGALAGVLVGGWAAYEGADRLRAVAHPKPAADEVALRQDAPCPGAVTISATGTEDAQFKVMEPDAGHTAAEINTFIVIGKEAAASGRMRDAEIAYIMACRVAARPGMDPVKLADAKYQLARHFANVAATSSGAKRDDLVKRARTMYGDSLRIYAARLGKDHEKTNFASDGLAALDAPMTVAESAPAKASTQPAPTPAPAADAQRTAATPQPPAPQPARVARNDTRILGAPAARPSVRPSFDCTRAHSRSEKTICSDAQLAQMDRDLARVYAQAKAGARDVRDFRRRSDAQWQRREQTCRGDRECLVAWYEQRRAQLLEEIDSQRGRQTAAAR